MPKADTTADPRPKCPRMVRNDAGNRTRCNRPAVWCNVVGEFGVKRELLCNPCVQDLRGRGWTVRYQLEGDNPPPLATES